MRGTIQDHPLAISDILAHGQTVHARSQVVTLTEGSPRRASFAEVGERAARLAGALRRLGIRAGDRVATFGWNTQEHLEAYLAIPSMGAVLHTLNIRLFPEQLVYVVGRHAAVPHGLGVHDDGDPVLALVQAAGRIDAHAAPQPGCIREALELQAHLRRVLRRATPLGIVWVTLVQTDENVAFEWWHHGDYTRRRASIPALFPGASSHAFHDHRTSSEA